MDTPMRRIFLLALVPGLIITRAQASENLPLFSRSNSPSETKKTPFA